MCLKNDLTNITGKLVYWNFHLLEVASRCRDPQLQVSEDYSYLTKNEGKRFCNLVV